MTGLAGYPDGQPLFFTLHGWGGVKKQEELIEGHCFLHVQERVSVLKEFLYFMSRISFSHS